MSTPFQRGQQDGQWTEEKIRECGFNSAEDCLKHQEKVHQEELASLTDKRNPEYATRQAEYLEGIISGTRQSLQRIATNWYFSNKGGQTNGVSFAIAICLVHSNHLCILMP